MRERRNAACAFGTAVLLCTAIPQTADAATGLKFSLPKDWTPVEGAVRAGSALDDLAAAIPATPDTRLFAHRKVAKAPPQKWREWIVLRSYKPGPGSTPAALATAVRAALASSCPMGKHVTIKLKTPDPAVPASGYHICSRLLAEPVSHVVLYKIMKGPKRFYLMTRQRRASPLAPNKVTPLAKAFPSKMKSWMSWYKSVRLNNGKTAKQSKGSAFAIGARYLVTNEHVVRNCKKLTIPGHGDAFLAARDETADLALLRTKKSTGPAAPFGGPEETRLGMAVMVAGFPLGDALGNSLTVTTGTINGHGGLKGKKGMVRFDAAVQKGNSGGPLLSRSGHVIGVVRGILDPGKAQNVNFAITVPVVEAFLKRHRIAFEKAPPGPAMSPPDLADKAKAFTVQVECWK